MNLRLQATRATRFFFLALLCAGPSSAHAACADAPRFTARGGEIHDTRNNLVWRRCSLGGDWIEGCGCVGAARGLTLPDATAAASRDGWRLPTADELLSLVDTRCGTPATDTRFFPDVPIDPNGEGALYWTSTPAGMLGMTITIDFRDGTYDMHSPGLNYLVRPVKPAAP